MANEDVDVTLRLRAIDDTGRVLDDASRRAKAFADQFIRGLTASTTATNQLTAGITNLNNTTQKHTAAVAGQSAAMATATKTLLGYASGFLSVTAAIDTAVRGYKKFAESERDLEKIQAGGRVTRAEVDKLAASFEGLARLTGRSVGEVTQHFSAFKAQSGLSLDAAENSFKRVVAAATASGTTIETMSRSAISALTNMKVPAEELSGVLDDWVKTIPGSMMDTWSDASPRITSMLRSMGFTGTQAASQIGGAFVDLAQKMGSTRVAATSLESLLGKAKDINTTLGMMSTGLIDKLKDDPDKINKLMGSVYENAKKMGLFDPNISNASRSMIQSFLQLDDRDTQALQHAGERLEKIARLSKELGVSTGEVERRLNLLGGGPQMVVDRMGQSFQKMYEQVGKLLSLTGIPNALEKILASTASEIEKLVALADMAQQHLSDTRPQTVEGRIRANQEGKQFSDIVGEGLSAINPFSAENVAKEKQRQQLMEIDRKRAAEEAAMRAKAGVREGYAYPESDLYGDEEKAKLKAAEQAAERDKIQQEELKKPPRLRRNPAADLRSAQELLDELERQRNAAKPKMATGGEFTVPGSGRADETPVSFLGTPGERVTVESIPAADTKESLQRQQDKADIALREHFARFHGKSRPGAQIGQGWPGDILGRGTGAGGSGGQASGTGPGGGPLSGDGTGSGDGKTTTTPPATGGPPAPPTSGPGYNIGPYGQPMPPWGTHVTEGEDWGGGTGGGVAGGVPGLPGSPSGRALTKEERAAGGVVAGTGGGAGGNTSLAAQRERFRKELETNPALRAKVLAIAAGEHKNNDANTSVLESAMNRAAMMNTTLAHEMRLTKEGGYYAGYDPGALNNPAYKKQAEANLERALGGSNVSDYATENASGAWGRKRMSGGMFTKVSEHGGPNPELFGIPTGPGARGYDRYKAWKAKSEAGQVGPAQQAGTGSGAGPPAGTGGTGYDADIQFMRSRGGHDARDDPKDTSGAIHPELARRLAQAGRDYEAANPGKKANYGEMYRDIARQTRYRRAYESGQGGLAARPGPNAPHQGRATDIPDSDFRRWLHSNAGKYKVEFLTGESYRKDPVHVQLSKEEWAELRKRPDASYKVAGPATAAPGTTTVPPAPAVTVPPFKVGQTQGLPGTPSGPAIKRTPGPDAPVPHVPMPRARPTPRARPRPVSAPGHEDTAAGKGKPAPVVRPVSAEGHEDTAAGKGVRPASELAEGGTAGAGQDVLVGENGPEIMTMGPRSGTVYHPGTGHTGPGTEFPEGHDPRAVGLQPGGIGPFGSDLDVALGFVPAGPASSAGRTAGASLLGKLGGVAGKFAGGQVEHQLTREGLSAGGGILGAHRRVEDQLKMLQGGMPGSQIQPINRAYDDMRSTLGATIEPVVRPRIQQMGPLSMRWTRQSERQRQNDISRDQARSAPTDQGFV